MLEITANYFDNILGYQFTLEVEGLALESVAAGKLDMEDGNVCVLKNAVTVSWHRVEALDVADGEVLFTLAFRATRSGMLSDLLYVSSRVTGAEAYAETGSGTEILGLDLVFGDRVAKDSRDFALFQNQPNPFVDVTTVGFELPEAMAAKLTVFDVMGRVLKVVEGEFAAGYNEILLNQGDLGTTGVLYYRLDAGDVSASGAADFSATKKMIILK